MRPWTAAALYCLCWSLRPGTGGTRSTGRGGRTTTTAEPSAASERVLIVDRSAISAYSPLDPGATALLLNDKGAVPNGPACAHFNTSVYCVGEEGMDTWRFDRVDGSPLPPGPDMLTAVYYPGTGRMANINDEWLVTCGDWRVDQPNTCQVLHVNASQWVEIESEACGCQSAVAEHNGSVFVVGGWCKCEGEYCRRVTAAVWSLRISDKAAGNGTFRWRRQPDMNTPRRELGIASHNGYMYACGGYLHAYVSAAVSTADCERWREGMHSWQGIAPLPEGRALLHLLSVGGRLIAMGGYRLLYPPVTAPFGYKLDVFDYNEAEDTWSRLHDMPGGSHVRNMRLFGSAVVPAL